MSFTLTLTSQIPFGKYKGKNGDHIARSNPGYILWLERNVSWVSVSPEVRKRAVCVGMLDSEDRADAFGTASDFGFPEF